MKRFRGWVTSFVVGFALFIAGAAVANETDLGSSEEVAAASEETAQVEEQVVEVDEGSANEEEPVVVDESSDSVAEDETIIPDENTVIVGGDIPPTQDNCVQGEVSNMKEVDCLIANGIVPASDRETYMYHLGILEPQQIFSIPDVLNPYNPVFCYEIGKASELDGDCYCVNGEISDLREVDCLIASGLLAPETRQGYISYFEEVR